MEQGVPVPTTAITVYADRSFTFETKTPPTSYFLDQGIKGQEGRWGTWDEKWRSTVTRAQVREIAEQKMPDLNCSRQLRQRCLQVEGSARSIGLEVVG